MGALCSFLLANSLMTGSPVKDPNVGGQCALEVFSGSAAVSLGLIFARVPTMVPWDFVHSCRLNIVDNGHIVLMLVHAGMLQYVHMGCPCQSFSMARKPALRSGSELCGETGLSPKQQQLILNGNI